MISTIDGARRYLLNLLPPGWEYLYDDSSSGDVYLLFDALGALVKAYGFDLLEALRRELIPGPGLVQKLADWEKALGISSQLSAVFGSTAQRQAAVVAKLREFGAFCDPVVTSILGPLLGYADSTPVRLVKADRGALRLAHSYGFSADVPVANGASMDIPIYVGDAGLASRAGAQLTLNFAAATMTGVTVTLKSPWGLVSDSWSSPGNGSTLMRLASTKFAGKPVHGSWVLTVANASGGAITLYSDRWLFVEGIAVAQDTGGASAHWGVYADPAHLGERGSPPDLPAIRKVIERIKHSHTVGRLIQSLTPYPDAASGANAAIPDECVPT